MPPPRHAYCESEIDESLVNKPSRTPSSSKARSNSTPKVTVSSNSDSGYSSRTYNTTGSTGSRHSTSKTSISSRSPSSDRTAKNLGSSIDACERRPKTSTRGGASKGTSDSRILPIASPIAIDPTITSHAMAAQGRPLSAVNPTGGYYVWDSSSPSSHAGSPTATFAPSSYHAPAGVSAARPRSASSSRSRPTSVCIPANGGTWVQGTPSADNTISARPTHAHTQSTPQISAQQRAPRSGTVSAPTPTGTWVRDPAPYPSAPPSVAQPVSRPPLQQRALGAQSDGRRASMYGAPIVQHHHNTIYQVPGFSAPNVPMDPARAAMPPPQSLPIRTSSRPQSHVPSIGSSDQSWEAGAAFPSTGYDPNMTIRHIRTSSIRRPTILTQQPKSKSTSYYTKNSGVQLETNTTNARASENRRQKIDKHTESAREYQERMNSRASKTSQELTAEALEDRRRRSKKDRAPASEPLPKARSVTQSQSRHSRDGSSVSRTGTETDRAMRLTIDGKIVKISGDTSDRNISIRNGEDGTPQITVGSPNKRRETGYFGTGSTMSQSSFADRARLQESAKSAADALTER